VYGLTVDDLIREMKKKAKEQEKEDNSSSSTERYAVLAAYATFLRKEKGKTAHATCKRVTGAREFFESHSVEFSDRQFRLKVKLERPIKRAKTARDKEEIIEIMQATQEPFLKLAELWHAATGRRPEEIFALRHRDIDTKRRKFRLRSNWLAYDGLCRTQRLAKVLCSALIILYDWWLLLVVVVVVLLLLPPPRSRHHVLQ
jgi:integrase